MTNQNLVVGWDPTGAVSVDQAGLAALVNDATVAADKGLVLYGTNTPDATVNTNWKRFIWIKPGATSSGVYVWNEAATLDTTYLKWQSILVAGVGVGTITNEMIADGTILNAKLASGIDAGKLTGSLSAAVLSNLVTTTSVAGGAMSGTFGALAIVDSNVTTSKIADLNVTNAKLEAGSTTAGITSDKLKVVAVANTELRVNSAATAWETYVSNNINDVVAVPATNGYAPRANGTTFAAVAANSSSFGRVLQVVEALNGAKATNSGTVASLTSALAYNSTGMTSAGMDTTVTVISATSKLYIEVELQLYALSASSTVIGALFNANGAAAALSAGASKQFGGTGGSVIIRYNYAHGLAAGGTVTFYTMFGTDGATAYLNSPDGTTAYFGGKCNSSIRIIEVV